MKVNLLAKRLLGFLVLCAILQGALGQPAPARAAADQPYWQDNFDQGADPGWDFNWWVDGYGGWRVEDGRLIGDGHQWVTYRGDAWGSMGVTYKFTLISLSRFDNLHFNFQVSGPNRYFLQLLPTCDGVGEFCGLSYDLFADSGDFHGTIASGGKIMVDLPAQITVRVIFGTIDVFINDNPVMSAKEMGLPPGNMGFETNGAKYPATIDDVQVWGTYFVEGNVYLGQVGDLGRPLENANVQFYGSNMPYPEVGTILNNKWTDPNGHYAFMVSEPWIYYIVFLPGDVSLYYEGATSKDGIVRKVSWIELDGFPPVRTAYTSYENNFWKVVPGESAPDWTPTWTPSPAPPRPIPSWTYTRYVPEPRPEPPGPPVDWNRVIVGAAAVAGIVLVVGVIRLARRGRGKPGRERRESEPRKPGPSAPPLLPLVRTLRIWVTDTAKGVPWPDAKPLAVGHSYSLHVQIRAWVNDGKSSDLPDPDGTTHLNVVFFTPASDFRMEQHTTSITIGKNGASTEAVLTIAPLRKGMGRIRVGIYAGNTLLQSAVIDAGVGLKRGKQAIVRTIDYVADPTLAGPAGASVPDLSIFTNQAPDGTHWIGLFSADRKAGPLLNAGDLHTFDAARMVEVAKWIRTRLLEAEGTTDDHFGFEPPLDERALDKMEPWLVRMAAAGYRVYDDLFLSGDETIRAERVEAMHKALQEPGLISVARCKTDGTTFPWAALYNLPLRIDRLEELVLCPLFRKQLLGGKDLLDRPQECQAQAGCPLKGENRLRTVCPFGFWGLLHQIEQPLQQIAPTSVDAYPREVANADLALSRELACPAKQKARLALGIYPKWDASPLHIQEIELLDPKRLDVTCETDGDKVLSLLQHSDHHLIYFFCHGRVAGDVFMLQFGGKPGIISSAALIPFEMRWEKHPLVFLNGCATMDMRPDLIHGFLGKLRRLGASAVIGTEIPVTTDLARAFGKRILQYLVEGGSVGEAFLSARRELQRRGNPLGLVYACFSPADLHLHDPVDCKWCKGHMGKK